MLRTLVILVLAAHGIGHTIGIVGGWAGAAWGGSSDSWLLSPVLGRTTGIIEGVLWLVPAVGFIAAAWLLLGSNEAWRWVALASAVVSLMAIALFPQQLSTGSLVGAVVVDAVVIVGLLALNWPAAEAVGA